MAGFGLNLKLVLYLQSQCLTESLGFLNPPLLQAAKRYMPVYLTKRPNMKLILERNLDFRQFQNLLILTFITVMLLLGMLNSLEFKSYILIELVLIILNILFIAILFTRKGLHLENQKLYVGVFLFGLILKKTLIETSYFQELKIQKGKLSTNYAYSYDIKEFHNWEPDLNQSVTSFTISMVNENQGQKQKILMLTKAEKAKAAINFIVENTNLKY